VIPNAQLFRDVFNASPIGIAVENLEGQPLFVNPAFCSFLGFSEEELCNKHCVDFSPPEDAEKDWALFQQLRAGSIDHYQLEKRYFRRDGSLVWGNLSIALLKNSPSPLVIAMVEGITDKNAEEARFRGHAVFIESSDDAIATATLDGIIVSWNTGGQKIYGYTEAEAVGKPISMLVPPELPDEENKILETLKSGDRIEHFETVRVTKTGKRINVSLTISPIKDSTGRTVGISGIARDITDRKLAEQALRASEERLRLAQQAARIGTFDWNIRTGVNTWTPELEAMYGLPPGGFGGTQTVFENLVHPDDRAGVIELVDRSLKTGQPANGEWRVVWRDRSVHWIAGRWQVFMDASGEPSRMIGVNIDVTEHKQADERLREYEEAVEGAEDMIGVIDREYRFLLANRQYLKMRNLTREQVVGHFVPEILGGEIFETVIKPKLDECFQGKVVKYEMKFSYPTVGERDLLLSYFPIEGANGVDRAACILHDITDRKRAEEALSGMTRKLIETQEQERTRIGRELHDDINQRLAMLAIELEQLQDNPSEVRSRVQELRKQTIEISDDVQALSHELDSSKLERLGAIRGMRSWCGEFAERQGIQVEFKSPEAKISLPREIGLCLFRVLQEALHNAAKYSGVKRMEVQLREDAGEIHLLVSDLGRGFELETAMQGRGLGLTSMQERVRLINGIIEIQSKPMGGTTIHVRVPLRSEHSQGAAG
jgi:PAS domain S-box-containing protein